MEFEDFIIKIGVKVKHSTLFLQSIVHNVDKERYEITLKQAPIYEWEIEDADALMDYIANDLDIGVFVDGINEKRIDVYYNISDGEMAYYSVEDKCFHQYAIRNEALLPLIDKMEISKNDMSILEEIGIKIYQDYGKDCYNYAVSGSPVDVELIHRNILKLQQTMNCCPKFNHKNVKNWAQMLVEYWDSEESQ